MPPDPITPGSVEAAASADRAVLLARVAELRVAADRDPLLAAWSGPYGGVPPWDRLDIARLPAAFTTALALLAAEVEAIATDPAPPTFANTIVPLEDSGRHFQRATALFSVVTRNLSSPEVQALDRTWSPRFAAAMDEINFNSALFGRVAHVHEAGAAAGLSAEQRRLVTLRHDAFVRAGAGLSADDKSRLGRINQELAVAFTDFSTKLLADEETWVVLDAPEDLAGLPESLRGAYAAAAADRGLPGKWAVVNTRSSVEPFLTAASRRDLREAVWKAFKRRGDNGDGNDTKTTVGRILSLRAERAALLGFSSHAHWRMSDTMAKDPAKAMELMLRVWPAAVARVADEVADLEASAKQAGDEITIEPWDYLYYAEHVRKGKYDVDEDEIKPYLELDNMIAAAMWMAERLYGLAFTEVTGKVPVFHPDVRVWHVSDEGGRHVGLFYGDYFARPGKRSGAWCQTYRDHETFMGEVITPVTSNNNNFVRGAAGLPVQLSLDDAHTLFHEFGHALHDLLSEVNYPGLATSPRDFVEYPSQVHEMWLLTRPVLDRFARHCATGQPMPQPLVEKIIASTTFNRGYNVVEYLSCAIVDMELHTLRDPDVDLDAFERELLTRIGAPRQIGMRHRLPHFSHLFASDSYSAGYYSYIWSEVMDADTRQAFKEAGDVFDGEWAGRLRRYILAPGNSTDPVEAYRSFRGRDPDVKALLEKYGFPLS